MVTPVQPRQTPGEPVPPVSSAPARSIIHKVGKFSRTVTYWATGISVILIVVLAIAVSSMGGATQSATTGGSNSGLGSAQPQASQPGADNATVPAVPTQVSPTAVPTEGLTPQQALDARLVSWDKAVYNQPFSSVLPAQPKLSDSNDVWLAYVSNWIHSLESSSDTGDLVPVFYGHAWDAQGAVLDVNGPFYPVGEGANISTAAFGNGFMSGSPGDTVRYFTGGFLKAGAAQYTTGTVRLELIVSSDGVGHVMV